MTGSQPQEARVPWGHRDVAKRFRASHGTWNENPYTMFFNGLLEKAMVDPDLSGADYRVLLGTVRDAYGNLSDEAVDALPPFEGAGSCPQPAHPSNHGRPAEVEPGHRVRVAHNPDPKKLPPSAPHGVLS